jgi:hypothetical protein
MTLQDDQNFYEKKERLLRRVQEGTATPSQKEWLIKWGFLEKPKPPPLLPTYENPTRTNRIYRYRRRRSVPTTKLEGQGGPGTHINRNGKLVADPKWKPDRRKK